MADKRSTEIEQSRPYLDMIADVQRQASIAVSVGGPNRAFELAAEAIDRLDAANSWDEIFTANNVGVMPGAEDAASKGALTIQEAEFLPAQEQYKQGGVGVYAFVVSVTDLGEEFKFTTGSVNVVMSLYRAQKLGVLKGARIRISQRGRMFLVDAP